MVDVSEARKCLIDIFNYNGLYNTKDIVLTKKEKKFLKEHSICNGCALRKHPGADGEYYTKFHEGHFMLNRWQLIVTMIQAEKSMIWQDSTDFVISEQNYEFEPYKNDYYICTIHSDGKNITDPDLTLDKDGYMLINSDILSYLLARAVYIKFELDLNVLKDMNAINFECIDFDMNYNQEIDQITDEAAFMNYLKCQSAISKKMHNIRAKENPRG